MSAFSVQASIANPDLPERRLGVELVVDTGATYTLLPDEVVRHLDR
jgi:predicted aspartyl protease